MDYKTTLNLPKTDFPMKANLKDLEPRTISRWQEQGTYRLIQERNKGRQSYILHDGPPYANGHIHIGHALNKILKDIIVKYKSMCGFSSPYVPGLGLPRPPHRAPGAQEPGVEERFDDTGGDPEALPRICREVHRHPARRVQAAGRVRRLGQSLPHHELCLRGGHRARARKVRGHRRRLQGQEAGVLVRVLRDRPCRGRSGVRGPRIAVHLGQVRPARRGEGASVAFRERTSAS